MKLNIENALNIFAFWSTNFGVLALWNRPLSLNKSLDKLELKWSCNLICRTCKLSFFLALVSSNLFLHIYIDRECRYPSTRIGLKGNQRFYTSALTYVYQSITFVLNKYYLFMHIYVHFMSFINIFTLFTTLPTSTLANVKIEQKSIVHLRIN